MGGKRWRDEEGRQEAGGEGRGRGGGMKGEEPTAWLTALGSDPTQARKITFIPNKVLPSRVCPEPRVTPVGSPPSRHCVNNNKRTVNTRKDEPKKA